MTLIKVTSPASRLVKTIETLIRDLHSLRAPSKGIIFNEFTTNENQSDIRMIDIVTVTCLRNAITFEIVDDFLPFM